MRYRSRLISVRFSWLWSCGTPLVCTQIEEGVAWEGCGKPFSIEGCPASPRPSCPTGEDAACRRTRRHPGSVSVAVNFRAESARVRAGSVAVAVGFGAGFFGVLAGYSRRLVFGVCPIAGRGVKNGAAAPPPTSGPRNRGRVCCAYSHANASGWGEGQQGPTERTREINSAASRYSATPSPRHRPHAARRDAGHCILSPFRVERATLRCRAVRYSAARRQRFAGRRPRLVIGVAACGNDAFARGVASLCVRSGRRAFGGRRGRRCGVVRGVRWRRRRLRGRSVSRGDCGFLSSRRWMVRLSSCGPRLVLGVRFGRS